LNGKTDEGRRDAVFATGSHADRIAIEEDGFPFEEFCDVAELESWRKEVNRPLYHIHKWWAKRFRYDEATDTYVCPDGQRLSPTYVTKVRNLPLTRYVNEAVVDRMARRLARRPDILHRRRECVEHPFGSIKQWMGQGAFLMRRLDNVRGEFSLTALAYNMRRAINLVGVPTLIEAACP